MLKSGEEQSNISKDSLQQGNSNSTIPVSQSHPFSYCNVPNMSSRNPDYVYSTVIESASSKITYAVQSTNNTERRGDMVGGGKPFGQICCLDSSQPGNRNSTIPVSQSSVFFVGGTSSVFLLKADSITVLST
jgi:hypothetical protein